MGATPAVHGADAASLSASAVTPFRPAWYPQKPDNYRDYKVGFINGVQYWVNADSTTQSIEADFQKMAEEDHINGARLAFWTIRLDLLPFDFIKKDGKIVWGGIQPEAKEILKTLRKWYADGLIDPDYVMNAQGDGIMTKFLNGKIGYVLSLIHI